MSGNNPYVGPSLLKLHGDVHHPQRMVLTEDDYDGFLRRYPLMATYLAAHLIDHSAVLIGYSLEDPDMRQLLTVIRDRLGRLARPLWCIQVDAPSHVISRYERRGVHVINLPRRSRETYGGILADLFTALRNYWQREVIDESQSTDERTLADLRLPPTSSNTCYFAVPLDLVSWYREILFPIVQELGFVPVFARDVLTPEGTVAVKIDALISRARVVVVDVASANSMYEARLALNSKASDSVLLVQPEGEPLPLDIADRRVLQRPMDLTSTAEEFSNQFRSWLAAHADVIDQNAADEADRLLTAGEARAALISAVSQLERELVSRFSTTDAVRRPEGLSRMLQRAAREEVFSRRTTYDRLVQALRLRNEALHLGRDITIKEAREAVAAVRMALQDLQAVT